MRRYCCCCNLLIFQVSIHAPVKDATPLAVHTAQLIVGFNPRTRKGCDTEDAEGNWVVSGFNPRTRKGCDLRRSRA